MLWTLNKQKIKAPKYSSDNSSTLKNFSPKNVKKNDAATSTHIESSNVPDMLSFQIINNSPTFDGKPNELYVGQGSPWSRSPIGADNSKDESDIIKSNKRSIWEEEPHKSSKVNSDRRMGGGFMYSHLPQVGSNVNIV